MCQTKENNVNFSPIQVDNNMVVINKVIVEGYRATIEHKDHLVTQQGLVTIVSKLVSVNITTIDITWDDRTILPQKRIDHCDSCYLGAGCRDKRALDQNVKGLATTKVE